MGYKTLLLTLPLLLLVACSSSSDSNNSTPNELNSSNDKNEINNSNDSNKSNDENVSDNSPKNIAVPSCSSGIVELKSGDKIEKISDDPEIEITHSEDGNKSACLNNGEAEIIRK